MGNKSEEVELQNEIDNLEDEEIKINLEIYKLQSELNKRLPKKNQKKLKKNYEEIINKWKSKKGLPKEYQKLNLDPYDILEIEKAKKSQEDFYIKKEAQNKKNEIIAKDNYLDVGITKLKKRIK